MRLPPLNSSIRQPSFMPSATIKLFLVRGDAKRLRTAELSNWTGKAVAGPRSELDSRSQKGAKRGAKRGYCYSPPQNRGSGVFSTIIVIVG